MDVRVAGASAASGRGWLGSVAQLHARASGADLARLSGVRGVEIEEIDSE